MTSSSERILSVIENQVLTENGTSKKTEEKFKEIEISLKRNRLNYLRQHCILRLLRNYSMDNEELRRRLAVEGIAHLKEVVNFEEDCWKSRIPSVKDWNKTKQLTVNAIKDQAKVECDKISSWLQECCNTTSEVQVNELLLYLKEKVKAKDQKEETVDKLKKQIHLQNIKNYKLLSDNCQVLCELINNYQSEYLMTQTQSTIEYLTTKTTALDLKIKVIKLQLMVATYSEDKVAALKEIKSYLDANRQQIELQLIQVQQSLEHYTALGEEFIKLAQEYHQIKEEIENKRWALNELGKSNI